MLNWKPRFRCQLTPLVNVGICDLFPASLSVDDKEDEVKQLARTLQSCLELTEPVQQIQLVKKVGFRQRLSTQKSVIVQIFGF